MTTYDTGDQSTGRRAQLDALKRQLAEEGFDVDRTNPLVIDRTTLVSADQEWTCEDLLTVADIFLHAANKKGEGPKGEFLTLAVTFYDAHDAQCTSPA